MKRPESGPPSTRRTGAAGPNPGMPSFTILPAATATSVALPPHAPPCVAMSTPWSSDHWPGGTATDAGWNGNTKPPARPAGGGDAAPLAERPRAGGHGPRRGRERKHEPARARQPEGRRLLLQLLADLGVRGRHRRAAAASAGRLIRRRLPGLEHVD